MHGIAGECQQKSQRRGRRPSGVVSDQLNRLVVSIVGVLILGRIINVTVDRFQQHMHCIIHILDRQCKSKASPIEHPQPPNSISLEAPYRRNSRAGSAIVHICSTHSFRTILCSCFKPTFENVVGYTRTVGLGALRDGLSEGIPSLLWTFKRHGVEEETEQKERHR